MTAHGLPTEPFAANACQTGVANGCNGAVDNVGGNTDTGMEYIFIFVISFNEGGQGGGCSIIFVPKQVGNASTVVHLTSSTMLIFHYPSLLSDARSSV